MGNRSEAKKACQAGYAERKRRAGGDLRPAEKRLALEWWEGCCAYCGNELERGRAKMAMDHVVPVSAGGRTELGNMVPACWGCNASKKDREVGDWLAEKWPGRAGAVEGVLADWRAWAGANGVEAFAVRWKVVAVRRVGGHDAGREDRFMSDGFEERFEDEAGDWADDDGPDPLDELVNGKDWGSEPENAPPDVDCGPYRARRGNRKERKPRTRYFDEHGNRIAKRDWLAAQEGKAKVSDRDGRRISLLHPSEAAKALGVPGDVQLDVFALLRAGVPEALALRAVGADGGLWEKAKQESEEFAARVAAMGSAPAKRLVEALLGIAEGKAQRRREERNYKHAVVLTDRDGGCEVVELDEPVLTDRKLVSEGVSDGARVKAAQALLKALRVEGFEGGSGQGKGGDQYVIQQNNWHLTARDMELLGEDSNEVRTIEAAVEGADGRRAKGGGGR